MDRTCCQHHLHLITDDIIKYNQARKNQLTPQPSWCYCETPGDIGVQNKDKGERERESIFLCPVLAFKGITPRLCRTTVLIVQFYSISRSIFTINPWSQLFLLANTSKSKHDAKSAFAKINLGVFCRVPPITPLQTPITAHNRRVYKFVSY